MDARILLIEDDPEIAGLVTLHLRDEGHPVEHAASGDAGLRLALQGGWALIILDLMLPGVGGLDICRQLREHEHRVPILMLTAKSEEIDKVLGLELGADDYLTKPFSIRELLARVKAILRRAQMVAEAAGPGPLPQLDYDGLTINLGKRRVTLGGKPVELTAKEFDLLALFANNPGKPFNREQLLNQVWGYSYTGYEHTVNSHINRLRAKIEADPSHPRYIITVWGFGYRFAEPGELGA
ncbi:MAG TPA: response regulator transcription factor [bacterium]|nr:response regulator transcription factor [bacterium]